MTTPLTWGLTFAASLLSLLIYRRQREHDRNPRRLPYPPGPKGYPIIGNFLSIPRQRHWLGFKKLSETYGDIVFFKSLGMNHLILDSLERTTELLDHRSSKYSSRGGTTLLLELMNWENFNFAFIPYGNWWKRQRKIFHDYFTPIVIDRYDEIQTREIHAFLGRLLQSPEDFQEHIPMLFASISMDIVYGIKIPSESKNNPYVTVIREAFSEGLAVAGIPGMYLVDHFPVLKWLPSWLPGAGFQKVANKAREVVDYITITKTLDKVKQSMKDGTQQLSMVSGLLDSIPLDADPHVREEEELLIRSVAGVSYAAGADTTASSLSGFFLAMAMYPNAQRKAQAEIDSVTGGNRLPDFHDRPSLPYLEALVLETMRWHPVTPLAVPHMSTEDDEYDGYFIPKGTFVFANVWSILNDPKIFHNPSKFDPDRYIENPDLRNPHTAFFGFGRRMCPGRFFSNRNLFTTVTSILSVFDILPPIDKYGKPIPLEYESTTGIVSYPTDFTCRIVPRSAAARKLIIEAQLQSQR